MTFPFGLQHATARRPTCARLDDVRATDAGLQVNRRGTTPLTLRLEAWARVEEDEIDVVIRKGSWGATSAPCASAIASSSPAPPPWGADDAGVEAQARRCLDVIVAALREAGAQPEHVVRTRMYLVNAADHEAVGRAHGAVFGAARPASTMVVVAALLDPRWKVEIEAEAIVPD